MREEALLRASRKESQMITMSVAKDLLQGKYNERTRPYLTYFGPQYLINREGMKQLKESALKLLGLKGMQSHSHKLIRFLSPESLPKYLASEESEIRSRAKRQMEEIDQGYKVQLIEAQHKGIPTYRLVREPIAYNYRTNSFVFELPDAPAESVLDIAHAAESGDFETVASILRPPGTTQEMRNQALLKAAEKGETGIVTLLLTYGVSERAIDAALHAAVTNSEREVIKYLLQKGADINREFDELFPLESAIRVLNHHMVDFLLQECGAQIDAIRQETLTLLATAIRFYHSIGDLRELQAVRIKELLIAAGLERLEEFEK